MPGVSGWPYVTFGLFGGTSGGGGTYPAVGPVGWTRNTFEYFRLKYGVNVKQLSTGLTFRVILKKDWETISQHMGQELSRMQTTGPLALVAFSVDDYPNVVKGEPLIEVTPNLRWVRNNDKDMYVNDVHVCVLWLCVIGGRS